MSLDKKTLLKSLAPEMVMKAVQAFDRSTAVVIGICWSAALLMMVFTIYTLNLSTAAKRSYVEAMATEPALPLINKQTVELRRLQAITERMQRRFPELTFTVRGQAIAVASNDGSKFRQWLLALSFMDTISPELHWSIEDLCVGKCLNTDLMHATVRGDRITFALPRPTN